MSDTTVPSPIFRCPYDKREEFSMEDGHLLTKETQGRPWLSSASQHQGDVKIMLENLLTKIRASMVSILI
jgi:hypothetical protein